MVQREKHPKAKSGKTQGGETEPHAVEFLVPTVADWPVLLVTKPKLLLMLYGSLSLIARASQ